MDKIYVIAGNKFQFDEYRRRKLEEMTARQIIDFRYADIVYVSSRNVLRGVADPHGVFIGTWKERKDMEEIFQELLVRQTASRPTLQLLYEQWRNANP